MEQYVPDSYQESILKVNYELLKSKGVKCLLFDLDNTIAPYNKKECSIEIKELFSEIKKDFNVFIFSNSPKCRVSKIANQLEVDFICSANKPSSTKFLKFMKDYKFNENEIAIIGDQLLTDIKGGNKVGIISVLVNPISTYDPIWTKISRLREKKLKKKLRKLNLFKGRFYDEKV